MSYYEDIELLLIDFHYTESSFRSIRYIMQNRAKYGNDSSILIWSHMCEKCAGLVGNIIICKDFPSIYLCTLCDTYLQLNTMYRASTRDTFINIY